MASLYDRVAEQQRAYLRHVVSETGRSLTQIAADIDSPPSTLTRFVNKKPGAPRMLSTATMERVAEKTGIALPVSETPAPGKAARRSSRGFRDEGEPFKHADNPGIARAVKALTDGRAAADPWTLRTRALELRGFLPGDTVIVDLGILPKPGDAVCAQVYDRTGFKAETVFRVYEPPYLLAASNDPAFRKPIHIDPEHVAIKGVLLPHRLRLEPAA